MFDLEKEKLIALAAVPKEKWLPVRRGGKRLAVTTVWRWATHGIRGRQLETVKIGGQRCTSIEALKRFFSGNQPTAVMNSSNPTPTCKLAARNRKEVEQQLDELGI